MPNRKIVHRKVIMHGGGIKDVIVEYTNKGIRYLKKVSIDGVKRLVPYAFKAATHLGNKGIDTFTGAVGIKNPHIVAGAKEANGSAAHVLGNLVEHNMHAKMGGRVAPTRNLILREINHALR